MHTLLTLEALEVLRRSSYSVQELADLSHDIVSSVEDHLPATVEVRHLSGITRGEVDCVGNCVWGYRVAGVRERGRVHPRDDGDGLARDDQELALALCDAPLLHAEPETSSNLSETSL